MTFQINPLVRFSGEAAVIEALVARSGGDDEPAALQEYFRAFDGGFEPSCRFTFNTPAAGVLYLYYNTSFLAPREPKDVFKKKCARIKQTAVEIALFIQYLTENGLVPYEYKKPQYTTILEALQPHWRRYQEFYPKEAAPILFVKTITPNPAGTLTSLWLESCLSAPLPATLALPATSRIHTFS